MMSRAETNAYARSVKAASRPGRERATRARAFLHYRREGMVTVCGVRLDDERERCARFTDDIGTLRRAKSVCECEVCGRGGVLDAHTSDAGGAV